MGKLGIRSWYGLVRYKISGTYGLVTMKLVVWVSLIQDQWYGLV